MISSLSEIKKTLQNFGYKDFKDLSVNRLVVLTNLDRYAQLEKIRDIFRSEGAIWDRSLISEMSALGAIRIKNYVIIVKPLKRVNAGGDNENRFFENINKAIKEYGSLLAINFVAPNKTFIVKNVIRALKVSKQGFIGEGIKADVVLKTISQDVPISLKAKNASFWQTGDKWSKDAKNWIDQLVYEKKVNLIPNNGLWELKPNIAWKANSDDIRKVIFGSDIEGKGAVITKTFFHEDFIYDGKNNILNVECSNIITTLADLSEEYRPWFWVHTDRSSRRSDLYKGLRVHAAIGTKLLGSVYKISDSYSTGAPAPQPDRPIAFTFGRMNPPTIGHKKLIDKVKTVCSDYRIYISQTHDSKKNLVTYEQKYNWLIKIFPGINVIKDLEIKTPFNAIKKMIDDGYNNISFVVGGDRVEEFKRIIFPYINNPSNSKGFVINKFQILNAGERDPDSEDISGMSASKMRQAAIDGNIELFRTGLPSISHQDLLALFNDVRKGLNVGEYKEVKSNIPAPKEKFEVKKNTHLEHIEDEVLNKGKDGGKESLEFLKSIVKMLRGHSTSKINITTKWDGSPAIICGINPETKKFFIGTKSVFAQEPKLLQTEQDIITAYGNVPDLAKKLKIALKYLPELEIEGVLQGDLLYTNDSLKKERIEQEDYITFRPNTITYAVPEKTELAKIIQNSKMGIVFHTEYHGSSFKTMNATFGFDASKLKKTLNVWVTDANLRDESGSISFTNQESIDIERYIIMAQSTFDAIPSIFFNELKINKNLIPYIKTYINAGIRLGKYPNVNELLNYVDARYTQQINNLKTEKGRLDKYKELAEIRGFLKKDKINFEKLFQFWNQISICKLKILKKLQTIKSIGTFLQTPEGFKSTSPEGFVLIDHLKGNAVKLIDRLQFSRANFLAEKDWVKG